MLGYYNGNGRINYLISDLTFEVLRFYKTFNSFPQINTEAE